ncbi:hypothetical protein KL86PLE_40345 [uncultured Pleomorphomonas sp.]|uniref:Uncharacterized protein n=1 Tax=uncultured Pleomorphomonas sp. TaxID=442121 RepID=A0A212LGD0_9HYPH|nr:hypothetical protein KL86PLE_40345 [uncultured Pleomorphomonas sp.]
MLIPPSQKNAVFRISKALFYDVRSLAVPFVPLKRIAFDYQ